MSHETIVITILIALAAVSFVLLANTATAPTNVPVERTFDGKIVYTTDTSLEAAPFLADCDARGGTFDTCGSICSPGAAVCAEVCAYTCTFSNE